MLAQKGKQFTNNASGNLNKKQQENKYKLIELDDFDVQMINPQFLQLKTLKKPLTEHQISLSKTNPNGVASFRNYREEMPTKDQGSSAVIFQKEQLKTKKDPFQGLAVLDTSELNIKPAYRPAAEIPLNFQRKEVPFESAAEKDKNTIVAALMKKGMKPELVQQKSTNLVVVQRQETKKVGPAEAKLRNMMNKTASMPTPTIEINRVQKSKSKSSKLKSQPDEIGQQITEEIDQYGNQSFQKLSVGYESAIKESIAGQSNAIKQSIRESYSASGIRESIRQDIRQSLAGSSRSLKEEIIEEISGSKAKSKAQQSIEEVYQEIFQDQEASHSLTRSRGGFKKNQKLRDIEELSHSHSGSKSFRMKTNVVKSLKMAEDLYKKEKDFIVPKTIDPKIAQELSKEKKSIKNLQDKISKWMSKPSEVSSRPQKNKDLYYNFKVEINKLISSDSFDSKLKKLVSFLSINSDVAPDRNRLNELQDNILKNVMVQIEGIKVGQRHLDEVQKVKKEYEQKMKEQLLIQEVNLRAQMNQKLSEKDFELKKMIAELESRLMARSFNPTGLRQTERRVEQYEVQSDYSIDSDNVSWKADLWELLPEFEKKKLYDKQSAQVTKFLADIMVNELKEEALDRSVDISFEFPEEYNNIPINTSYENRQKQSRFEPSYSETASFAKVSSPPRQYESKQSSDYLSDLPKLNVRKSSSSSSQSISSQKEDQGKFEKIKRDEKIKPEIIRILSDYKPQYLRKKQQVIRNLFKILNAKDSETQKYLYSSLQQMQILTEREFKKEHKVYIKAYEEELVMSLVGIYNRSIHKKQAKIEQELRNMYERLVVVCQVGIADKCRERVALDVEKDMNYNVHSLTKQAIKSMEAHPCVIEITANENYMDLKNKREEKQVKNDIVKHIVDVLTMEFARQFPKKKR